MNIDVDKKLDLLRELEPLKRLQIVDALLSNTNLD
jgi:hypothetical protein